MAAQVEVGEPLVGAQRPRHLGHRSHMRIERTAAQVLLRGDAAVEGAALGGALGGVLGYVLSHLLGPLPVSAVEHLDVDLAAPPGNAEGVDHAHRTSSRQ